MLNSRIAQGFSNTLMEQNSGNSSGSTMSPSISAVSNFSDVAPTPFETNSTARHNVRNSDWLGEGTYNTSLGSLHHRLQNLTQVSVGFFSFSSHSHCLISSNCSICSCLLQPLSNESHCFKQEPTCDFAQPDSKQM